MLLHHLRAKTIRKDRKRVGRGGKRGTTSGRGTKGQSSRSGSKKMRPAIYDLIKKLPKLRGWKLKSLAKEILTLNLGDLEKHFSSGETVNPAALIEKRAARTIGGRIPKIKVLGGGELKKKLNFTGVAFSKSARAAVEKAGGTIS